MKIFLGKLFGITLFTAATFLVAMIFVTTKVEAGYTNAQDIPTTYKNIGIPGGVAVLPNGDYWYADYQAMRIVKVSQTGTILRTVGRAGDGEGEFLGIPVSVALDDLGRIHVLEQNGCRIDVFDENGGLLYTYGSCGSDPGQLSMSYKIYYDAVSDSILVTCYNAGKVVKFSKEGTYLSEFTSTEPGDGPFYPIGIATDTAGKIYVVDGNAGNGRVQVFNPDYSFDFAFGADEPHGGTFNAAQDITVLSNGNIIVSSQNNYTVQTFNSLGEHQLSWGGDSAVDGHFQHPNGLALGPGDTIYVADYTQRSIQQFDANANFIRSFRNGGKLNGKFSNPTDTAYDSAGNLYVLDDGPYHGRVQKFSNAGSYISSPIEEEIGPLGLAAYYMAIDSTDRIAITSQQAVQFFDTDGNELGAVGLGLGSGNSQFNEARGIAFDSDDNFYVADLFNHRIQKFASDGTYITQWGTDGSGDTQFHNPNGVTIDENDIIYVSDDSHIRKFDVDGNFLGNIWSEGVTDSGFPGGLGTVAFDSAHNMFAPVSATCTVQVFDSSENYVESFGSCGSGIDEFDGTGSITINPVTDSITIPDVSNHRLQVFDVGVRIHNLIPSADVVSQAEDTSLVRAYWDPNAPGVDDINSNMYFGAYIVSDFDVNLSNDRNWDNVNAFSLPEAGKALLVNLNPTDAPGVSATHSLYIVKQPGEIGVFICPSAELLSDLTLDCPGGYLLQEGDTDLSVVTVDGNDYWKIVNLTGTGGLTLKASDITISASSTDVDVNETFSVTVTAHDQNSDNFTYYDGTVHFTSTSGTAVLPSNFTFSESDLGTHTFTNQFAFTEGGDYTITVEDLANTDLTATTLTIHVNGPTPTSTPTPTTGPTNTPGPTSTPGPTHTPGPTSTTAPTATPVELSCVQNQFQLKCQANILINGVEVSVISATAEQVCWDTNIETKGVVRYGLVSAATNDLTTSVEENYSITNHCFTLQNLTESGKYTFQIEATSPAGKVGSYSSTFTAGVSSLPETGGIGSPSCISLDTAVSFNSNNEAIIKYTTLSAANCTVSYGNSLNKNAFQSSVSSGAAHTSTLGLNNLDGRTDAYYQINCNVAATATDQAKTCTYNDVIAASQYVSYINTPSTAAVNLNDFIGSYFGTPAKTNQTLNTTALVGTAATAAIATLAYPQWLSYGLLWLRGKKKQKPWGLVYNASNMVPVAFATVRAISSAGQETKQAVTDTTGRFGFILDPDTYKITVDASGFDHFEKTVSVEAEQSINLDIPLTGAGKLGFFRAIQQGLRANLGKISIGLTVLGYLITITSVILSPNLINITILIAYFVQTIFLVLSIRMPGNGYIYNSSTQERIKGAFVRLFDVEEQRQVDVQMADEKGRYSFIGDKKDYYIRVDAPGYNFPSKDNTVEQIKSPSGAVFVKAVNQDGIHNHIPLDPI